MRMNAGHWWLFVRHHFENGPLFFRDLCAEVASHEPLHSAVEGLVVQLSAAGRALFVFGSSQGLMQEFATKQPYHRSKCAWPVCFES